MKHKLELFSIGFINEWCRNNTDHILSLEDYFELKTSLSKCLSEWFEKHIKSFEGQGITDFYILGREFYQYSVMGKLPEDFYEPILYNDSFDTYIFLYEDKPEVMNVNFQ